MTSTHTLWIISRGNAVLDLWLGFSRLTRCWLNPASKKSRVKRPLISVRADFWLFRNAQPYVLSFWKYHVVAFGPCRVLVTQKEHAELQPVLTCPHDCKSWGPWGAFEGQRFCCRPVLGFCLFACFPSQISRKHFYSKTKGIQAFLMCWEMNLREKNVWAQTICFIWE